MKPLTYKQAYVFALLGKDEKNSNLPLASLLLKLYACDFLDTHQIKKFHKHKIEKLAHAYISNLEKLSNKENSFQNIFVSTVSELNHMNLLSIKKTKLFKEFSLINLVSKAGNPGENVKESDDFIFFSIKAYKQPEDIGEIQKVISLFNQIFFSYLERHNKPTVKYEYRLFWPGTVTPEIYQCRSDLFQGKKHKYQYLQDKYVLMDRGMILKLRKKELHVKKALKDICHLTCFTKSQKLKFPLEKKDLNMLFKNTIPFNPGPIKSAQSLFEKLDPHKILNVNKRRYIHKFDKHGKIEFSIIKVADQKWKTLCIEAPTIETVLALSLLVNPEGAERLNYPEFLQKFT